LPAVLVSFWTTTLHHNVPSCPSATGAAFLVPSKKNVLCRPLGERAPAGSERDHRSSQRELAERAAHLEHEACALEDSKSRFQSQVAEQLQQLEWREQQIARVEEYARSVREKERALEVSPLPSSRAVPYDSWPGVSSTKVVQSWSLMQEREHAVKRARVDVEEVQRAAKDQTRSQKDESSALAKQFQDLQDARARNAREFEQREAGLAEQACTLPLCWRQLAAVAVSGSGASAAARLVGRDAQFVVEKGKLYDVLQEAKLTEMRRELEQHKLQQMAQDDDDRATVLQELKSLDTAINEARQMLRRYEAASADAKQNAAAAEQAALAAADRRAKVRGTPLKTKA
jgi:hypothetical protein